MLGRTPHMASTYDVEQHRLPLDDAGEGDGADQDDEAGDADEHVRRRAREFRRQLHVRIQVELCPQAHYEQNQPCHLKKCK